MQLTVKSNLKKILFAPKLKKYSNFFSLFLPNWHKNRFNSSLELWTAMLIFQNCKLKKVDDLYWVLDPMPSSFDLFDFYEKSYWQKYRSSSINLIRSRDLEHFIKINSELDFFSTPRTILNFGSGIGSGISNLFFLTSHTVINVEPGPWSDTYNSPRFTRYRSLSEVPQTTKIDFIYGSHSLEHVSNLKEMEIFIENRLASGGYVFWEVPNAHKGTMELTQTPKIEYPHTYYFTRRYFHQCGLNRVFNLTYQNGIECEGEKGSVIRYLGQKQFVN